MYVTSLTVKQFRCFASRTVTFDNPFVIIGGSNGSGKTSILEALYYACYLRSFRTHTTRELIRFDECAFSLRIGLKANGQEHEISTGYAHDKRVIKLDAVSLTSYKELLSIYRVIALTGEDTALVRGTPEYRRRFLDQAIILQDTAYLALLKKYGGITAQRNALLNLRTVSRESYELWTEQLTAASRSIREQRRELVAALESRVNGFLVDYFDAPFTVKLIYKPKESTRLDLNDLLDRERAAGYTLIGAHLDDCCIMISGRTSRQYASQGQQKLIALLLKIAQPAAQHRSPSCIFVLDDVIADLDNDKIRRLCTLLVSFNAQIILTSPLDHPLLREIGADYGGRLIRIDREE